MAAELRWQDAVDIVRPYVVQILTPRGSGTGFLFAYTKDKQTCGIATAAHVVRSARQWEEPIRIYHPTSKKSVMKRQDDRSIFIPRGSDTSAIVFQKEDLALPDDLLDLAPEGRHLRVGVEIGWVGFPGMREVDRSLCFFSGRISCWLHKLGEYLVDGVAIHGVSGGPAFHSLSSGKIRISGLLSAYLSNRQTGEALPGVCVISSVHHLQEVVEAFAGLEEAKEQETPATEALPPQAEAPPPDKTN